MRPKFGNQLALAGIRDNTPEEKILHCYLHFNLYWSLLRHATRDRKWSILSQSNKSNIMFVCGLSSR